MKISFSQVKDSQAEIEARTSKVFALLFEEVIKETKGKRIGLRYVIETKTIELSLTYCIKAL